MIHAGCRIDAVPVVPVPPVQALGASRVEARLEIKSQDPDMRGSVDLQTDIMLPNECLESQNSQHFASISADGRLVVYSDAAATSPRKPPCTPTAADKVRWSSGAVSSLNANYYLTVEHSGNIVVYRGAPPDGGKLVWTSSYLKSDLKGPFTLTMADDGLLKLEHKGINWLVWESVKLPTAQQMYGSDRGGGPMALYIALGKSVKGIGTVLMYLVPCLLCVVVVCCLCEGLDSTSHPKASSSSSKKKRGGRGSKSAGRRVAEGAAQAKSAALDAQALIAGRKIRYVD